MKNKYISPELVEIKVEDVITASILSTQKEGSGLNVNFGDLM